MSKIALEHGATIDKYVGDAIVIFFGDPETRGVEADALACVKMAIAMRKLEKIWRTSGIENPLKCRIGINTGYCRVRFFSVVDLVNRLEAELREGRAGRITDRLCRVDLVVIDELGYLPFAQAGGQLVRRGNSPLDCFLNQLARGEMMTVGDFHTMVENALVHVGAKMLALCDEIAPLVVGKTAAEAEAIIDAAIREALKELGDAAEAAFPEDDPQAGESLPETD